MPTRCLFYLQGQSQPCQILQASDAPALSPGERAVLVHKYCQNGCFLVCPVFVGIEQALDQFHREKRTLPNTASSYIGTLQAI